MNKLKKLFSENSIANISRPKGLKPVILILIILLAGTFLFVQGNGYLQRRQAEQRLAEGGCSNDTITAVVPYLQDGYANDLRTHVEKILKLPEFTRDPNCLYIVATYEANLGNIEQAKSYLKQLEDVYDPRAGFSTYFGQGTADIQKLREKIKSAESYDRQFKQSVDVFNSSSERR